MIRRKKIFVDSSFWIALLDKNSPDYQSSREKYRELAEKKVIFYSSSTAISETVVYLAKKVSPKIAEEFYSFVINSEASGKIRLIGYNKKYFRDTMDLYFENTDLFGDDFVLSLNLIICRNKSIMYFLTNKENREKLVKFDWIRFI